MTHLQQIAVQLWDAGFNPLPTNGKDKWPGTGQTKLKWRDYIAQRMQREAIDQHFRDAGGIGILCGKSNPGDPLGLEVIDVDTKNDPYGTIWSELEQTVKSALPGVWERLTACVVRTPSGGYHLHYLCAEVAPKQTAAGRCIEILGTGNFTVFPPTPGYYIEGGEAIDIHEITVTEREALHSIIRSLRQETPEEEHRDRPALAPATTAAQPWDRFNQEHSGVDVLIRNGWTKVYEHGKRIHMRRPGDTKAQTSGNWDTEKRLFYCFSTSTQLPHEKGLTAYALAVYLEFGGDWHRAARVIGDHYRAVDGVPPLRSVQQGAPTSPTQQTQQDEPLDFTRYEITTTTPIPEPVPVIRYGSAIISTAGNITMIGGQAKSGKTAVFNAWLAGAITPFRLSGQFPTAHSLDTLGATVTPSEGGLVLHIDTEQSRYDHQKGLRRVMERARCQGQPSFFRSFNIRGLSPQEHRQLIETVLQTVPDVIHGVHSIWWDGCGDSVSDPNDAEESGDLIRWMESLCMTYNCPLFTILHHNAGSESEKGRGHLGSGLERKAESVISVVKSKADDFSEIKAYRLRNAGRIEPVAFQWSDEVGYHVTMEGSRDRELSREDHRRLFEIDLLKLLFSDGGRRTYSEVVDFIARESALSDRSAKRRIDKLTSMGLLERINDGIKVFYKIPKSLSDTGDTGDK